MKKTIFISSLLIFKLSFAQDYIYQGVDGIQAKIGYNIDEELTIPKSKNCNELLQNGITNSGNYEIYPVSDSEPYMVYCDMENLGGGWTLFAYEKDSPQLNILSAMTQDNYGIVPNDVWISLKNNISEGLMFIDENNNVSFITESKINNNICQTLNSKNDLDSGRFLFHQENSGCNTTYLDYSFAQLSTGRKVNIRHNGSMKFDIWGYGSNTNSDSSQNELYFFIK